MSLQLSMVGQKFESFAWSTCKKREKLKNYCHMFHNWLHMHETCDRCSVAMYLYVYCTTEIYYACLY